MEQRLADLIAKGYPAHNIQVREALVDESVTLNGQPARIAGRKLQFPRVAMLAGPAVQYSWAAVLHNVQHNAGRFITD